MKNLKNILTLTLSLIITSLVGAQTVDNFIVEHNRSSLEVKIHLVNTPELKWDTLIPNMQTINSDGLFLAVKIYSNSTSSALAYQTDIINQANYDIGDTVVTILYTLNKTNVIQGIFWDVFDLKARFYSKDNLGDYFMNEISLVPNKLTFTDFLLSDTYLPCYTSIAPNNNVPTVYWESIEDNAIKEYIIKRNNVNIDTVIFLPGLMSWTDSTNTQTNNFEQRYTLEAIDSVGNIREGDVTTIRARNLSSVNGYIELDWNLPESANEITAFEIYEYDVNLDELTLITTVPSNILQYTVTNPDPTKSYVVGISNMSCTDSALKSVSDDQLLSNPVKSSGSLSIPSLSNQGVDKIINCYDITGRKVNPDTKNTLLIYVYESGKKEKVFIKE